MQRCHQRQSRFAFAGTTNTGRIAFAAFCLSALLGSQLFAQPLTGKSDTSQIAIWIKQLASVKFTDREDATRQLKMAGLPSIPELTKAAQGSNPEVTARAIECLSFFYESPDVEISIAADQALEQLLKEGPPAAAQRTELAFAFDLASARRKNSIAAIQSLGGILVPKTGYNEELNRDTERSIDEPDSIQHAILGKNWRGDLSSTKYFERLHPELRIVYVTSDAPLKSGDLLLYRNALHQMAVEARGGYLGISGSQVDPERCDVDKTAPFSPAEEAGLKSGDRLTHLNGMHIRGFLGLTTLLLQRKSGETVVLDVLRESPDPEVGMMEVEIPVTLGEWGTAPSRAVEKSKKVEKDKE